MKLVDVLIPVYEGYAETVACLASVLRTTTYDWSRIVIINDCSPDPRIAQFLRDLAAEHAHVELLENPQNLGFVATVNRGMEFDSDRDVVLLNSDVEVAGNWLHRLREAAYHHDNVASVTPFANNATICSFPNICKDNKLIFGLSLEEIDAQFAAEFTAEDVFQVPTGVGCCMYLRRDCLDQIGLFDLKAYGRGYGEENDWCQRAARVGRVNLHLANCFVYHKGGVSFGEEHSPRLAQALNTLDRKYPRYHADIQRFIARDPAISARVRAWLRLFAMQERPKILMISHKLSGGVQQHVDELAQFYGERALFLLMMPDKDGESVRLSCFDGEERLRDGLFFHIDAEYEKLVDLLQALGIGRVHFHHTMGLHTRLWGLARDLSCEYDLTIHDYYLVNNNPSLTDKDGRYVNEDRPDFDAQCEGHRPLPPGVDAQTWRANQRPIVEGASRVIFPSMDASVRFGRYFDVGNSVIAWHPDCLDGTTETAPQWEFPKDRALRVLILGALSKEKGADVLESTAGAMAGERIEFHLLGYAYKRLGGGVVAHAPYSNKDVHALIAQIKPDVVWFPAMWPETYSYTLSIALQNRLPVVVPDLGAFVERVQGRAHTAVVDWNLTIPQWRSFWLDVLKQQQLPAFPEKYLMDRTVMTNNFYSDQYVQATPCRPSDPTAAVFQDLQPNLYVHSVNLSRSERLLKRIWRFSRRPVGAMLISVVPFKLQRTIKRLLSHRPMHDIVGK